MSLTMYTGALCCLMLAALAVEANVADKPNVIVILADDLGYNDIGYNNAVVQTPNLDDMAQDGITLESYYTQPMCSPSRHALMTGRYPFRDGLQRLAILGDQPVCSPLDLPFLPNEMKKMGYKTHGIGKWHLGYCSESCTPNSRGFDNFYGIFGSHSTYYTHTHGGLYDFRDNMRVNLEQNGTHATFLYRNKAVDTIANHQPAEGPFFMYLSFQVAHFPLEPFPEFEGLYPQITNEPRRKYLGMVSQMDSAIGNVTQVNLTAPSGGRLIAYTQY